MLSLQPDTIRETYQMVDVAQSVRALDCGSRCRGFESHLPPSHKRKAFGAIPESLFIRATEGCVVSAGRKRSYRIQNSKFIYITIYHFTRIKLANGFSSLSVVILAAKPRLQIGPTPKPPPWRGLRSELARSYGFEIPFV